MKRKNRDPNSLEAIEAVIQRIRRMTKSDGEELVAELSHDPEGVYDPWSEENWPREKTLRESWNGAAPSPDDAPSPKAERAAGSD